MEVQKLVTPRKIVDAIELLHKGVVAARLLILQRDETLGASTPL
ncbi:MAG: hypothetical protein Q8M31_04765 [Beijerinckiaceae bacterium]|nr:hypothetical protein [Beijerinckiaceae bacterium]